MNKSSNVQISFRPSHSFFAKIIYLYIYIYIYVNCYAIKKDIKNNNDKKLWCAKKIRYFMIHCSNANCLGSYNISGINYFYQSLRRFEISMKFSINVLV